MQAKRRQSALTRISHPRKDRRCPVNSSKPRTKARKRSRRSVSVPLVSHRPLSFQACALPVPACLGRCGVMPSNGEPPDNLRRISAADRAGFRGLFPQDCRREKALNRILSLREPAGMRILRFGFPRLSRHLSPPV